MLMFGLTTEGIRALVTFCLLAPVAIWFAGKYLSKLMPQEGKGEDGHGRDYYLGFLVGRTVSGEDLDHVLKRLQTEDIPFQLVRDAGGEKVFTSRALPANARHNHEMEAGVLSGALYATLKTRFDVEEERCTERGDGYCKFVAVKG